jgi:hypothetical protein
LVVGQFGKETSQTRDYCVAEKATLRAARPDPSLRKSGLLRMTIKLHHYLAIHCTGQLGEFVGQFSAGQLFAAEFQANYISISIWRTTSFFLGQ